MSSIEWTEKTWNPVVGCSRVSPGCEHCYAEGVAHRGLSPRHKGLTVLGKAGKGPRWTGEVRTVTQALDVPKRRRKPTTYFVNSMSDLFHERIDVEFISEVFGVMASTPRHTYQVLTKRPSCAAMFFHLRNRWAEALPNVWLGVSVEDQRRAEERIPVLLELPAAVRFLSVEPLLEEVDLTPWLPGLDWVIVGGESGPGARPCVVDWLRGVVEQCRGAGVPVFVKQVGARPLAPAVELDRSKLDAKGGNWDAWPEDLRVREMPGVVR